MTDEMIGPDVPRVLRHLLATIAYRAGQVLHDAQAEYSDRCLENGVRSPREILNHMTNVLGYALGQIAGRERVRYEALDWDAEQARFQEILRDIDAAIVSGIECSSDEVYRLIQGPLADTLTHIGQLAMIRRVAGAPVQGENFIKADIRPGKLDLERSEVPEAG